MNTNEIHLLKTCPKCHSFNIAKRRSICNVYIASILITNLPIPVIKSKWYCYDCGNSWKVPTKNQKKNQLP
jgi:transposase-like protein